MSDFNDHPITIGFHELVAKIKNETDQGVMLGMITRYFLSWMLYRKSAKEVVRSPTATLTLILKHEENTSPWGGEAANDSKTTH